MCSVVLQEFQRSSLGIRRSFVLYKKHSPLFGNVPVPSDDGESHSLLSTDVSAPPLQVEACNYPARRKESIDFKGWSGASIFNLPSVLFGSIYMSGPEGLSMHHSLHHIILTTVGGFVCLYL